MEKLTPAMIHDQGQRNSCNGHAAAMALELAKIEKGLRHVRLSGSCLYAQISGNADQGSHLDRGMQQLQGVGTSRYDLCDNMVYRWRDVPQAARDDCASNRAFTCNRIDHEDELTSGMARGCPAVLAVHVDRNFEVDEDGFINVTIGPGNHAVCAWGMKYVNGKFWYRKIGSWSPRWGVNGCGWLPFESLREPLKHHDMYLIEAALDDPLNPLPPMAA
jgi:C1A family cysteine protease